MKERNALEVAQSDARHLRSAAWWLDWDDLVQEIAFSNIKIQRRRPDVGRRYQQQVARGRLIDVTRHEWGRIGERYKIRLRALSLDQLTDAVGSNDGTHSMGNERLLRSDDPELAGVDGRLDAAQRWHRIAATLAPAERDLLIARFVHGVKLRELAAQRGVTESRISQIISAIKRRVIEPTDGPQL